MGKKTASEETPKPKIPADKTGNERELSSSVTFVYKFMFSTIWCTGFGFGTAYSFIGNDSDAIVSLIVLIIGSLFIWFTVHDLKKVSIGGDQIIISNYFSRCRVSVSEIYFIDENSWFSPKLVWIIFKNKTPFGGKIKFIPTASFGDIFSYYGRKHSIVKYLEGLIKETEANKN